MEFYLVCGLCFLNGIIAKNILPDTIPRCYRNDPNLNDCLLKATQIMKSQIPNGIPVLGIPGLEPYVLPEAKLEQVANNLNFKMVLKNLTIHGLSNYKFSQFNYDPKTLMWHSKNVFENVRTTSHCDIAGKILVLPLTGQGTLLISAGSFALDTKVNGHLVKIKGVDHYEITNTSIDFSLNKPRGRFENFVGVRPEIIAAINNVIENNSEELIKEFTGTFKKFLLTFIKRLYSRVAKKIPYDELFPISDEFPSLNTI